MKLSEWKQDSYFFSGKVSEITRQLALAGIAVIWIFRYTYSNNPVVPLQLTIPLGLLAISLTLDLLQYVYATVAWTIFHRHHEKWSTINESDPDILAPEWINWPAWILFGLKIVVVIIAYSVIIAYLCCQWKL
jgi:hypothetical protein